MRLWDLPGARRFVDRACNALRGGSSLVISFPGAVPEGFDDTLAAELGNAFQVVTFFDSGTCQRQLRHLRTCADNMLMPRATSGPSPTSATIR